MQANNLTERYKNMAQFRIKGIDYADDSLQHGLGKGSGRGRPVGSKNGQVMPGAAYMKDYKIVGQKAVGDAATPTAINAQRAAQQQKNNQNQVNARTTPKGGGVNAATARTSRPQTASNVRRNTYSSASTPTANVAKGKNAVNQMMSGGASQQRRDFSAKAINEAGGINSREGRQIIYDNPYLNEDYKKQVAKTHGDSDGRSYPKAIEQIDTSYKQSGYGINPQANRIQTNSRTNNALNNDARTNAPSNAGRAGGGGSGGGSAPSSPHDLVRQNPNRILGSASPMSPGMGNTIREQTIPEQTIKEQTIPEQTIKEQTIPEQTITEQSPAQSSQPAQETPQQKSLWDSIGGWFSGVGKAIGDTAVGAWNTVSGAVNDAVDWVGDRLGEAGEWAQTAINDVTEWVGARGQEFAGWMNNASNDVNRFLNGYDETGTINKPGGGTNTVTRHVNGFFDNAGNWIGNAANDVSQWVGNAANDVNQWVGDRVTDAENLGRDIGSWWNGRDIVTNDGSGWKRVHQNGARENLANAANDATQWVSDNWNNGVNAARGFINDAGQWVTDNWNNGVDAADRFLNGYDENATITKPSGATNNVTRHVPGLLDNGRRALNDATQWVGNAANDVGQWAGNTANNVRNFINGPQPGTSEANPYYDLKTGQWIDPLTQTLGDRIWQGINGDVVIPATNAANAAGQWVNNNVVTPVVNGANTAGQWLGENVVTPVSNAANAAGQWVGNAANDVGEFVSNAPQAVNEWWNGTDVRGPITGITYSHTPGARENIGNALNTAGQWVSDTATDVGNWVGNTAQNVGSGAASSARALSVGVPISQVNNLNSMLANGQLSRDDYENSMAMLIDHQNAVNEARNRR